jgi:hypothetical protein
LAAKGAELKTAEDKSALERKQAQATEQKLVATITEQSDKLKGMDEKSFEVPDGKVTWVNQRSNVVWINLGLADGLQRQQVFSVYDQKSSSFEDAAPKGTIEVTRIIDSHSAEARITTDELTDPLLPGDIVFSPSWTPGRKIHFALAGLLDYNGDGKSDARLVKNVISVNGGVIDAEVDETGKRTGGPLSIHTRYLVQGERPDESSSAEVLAKYGEISAEADRLGIERISVEKLLEFMGYKAEVGGNELSPGGSGSRPTPGFRERKPASAY